MGRELSGLVKPTRPFGRRLFRPHPSEATEKAPRRARRIVCERVAGTKANPRIGVLKLSPGS